MASQHVKLQKLILVSLLISMFVYANNNQKAEENNMNKIMELLEEEIESGVTISCEGGEGVSVDIDKEYYELSSEIFRNKLKEKGFKFLENKEFFQKVLSIFKIEIKEDIRVFDIAHISAKYEDEFPSSHADGGVGLKVFDKKNGFITKIYRLPEIINYQKYDNLNILETSSQDSIIENDECSIYWWKDFYKDKKIEEDLNREVENIIALNNYLFYDEGNIDKLFENNHYFFYHLVLSNHYYSDLKLLKKVLNDVFYNSIEDFPELLWQYNEKEGLIINKQIFQIILDKPPKIRKNFLKKIEIEYSNLHQNDIRKNERKILKAFLEKVLKVEENYK